MGHLEEQLKLAGVGTMDDLKGLKEADIQKLPIPPGFRIKLKKALIKDSCEVQERRVEDIESIINRRNLKREEQAANRSPCKFESLQLYEQEDVFSLNEVGQEEQLQNKSFLETLGEKKIVGDYRKTEREYLQGYTDHSELRSRPLRSCLKRKFNRVKSARKYVRFSAEVMAQDSSVHKKYPKEGFKDRLPETSQGERHVVVPQEQKQYCWGCCKPIKQSPAVHGDYKFCSAQCLNSFVTEFLGHCSNCQRERRRSELLAQGKHIVCDECYEQMLEQEQVDLSF